MPTLFVSLATVGFCLTSQAQSFHPFPTGYGPEDMVVDTLNGPQRLLVSCCSRRPGYPAYGEIEAIDPIAGKRTVMTRIDEPAGLVLRPHGISLARAGEIGYLYVISHDDAHHDHPVVRYMVKGDSLIFIERLDSPLLVSPNALQAYPDGSLLVCNDAAVRGDKKDMIFRKKSGNILFYDGRGNWTIAARDLGMPAGLAGKGDRVYVSATLENCLYSFRFDDGQLVDKQMVCPVKGPDNIRIQNNRLIVTSHAKTFRFIRHTRSPKHPSPSLVVAVDPVTGHLSRLFYDNGRRISAGSVALRFKGKLIIGQIFEPFVGVVDPTGK